MDPFKKFEKWYEEQLKAVDDPIPSACCLSTAGTDGYPNARIVSLKEVKNGRFIITGPLNSRKVSEMQQHPRAALTFWWPATEKQVRVQGDVKQISTGEADRYFSKRPREAQIVSWASNQGELLQNTQNLEERLSHFKKLYESRKVPRPENWSGVEIIPIRIEFFFFQPDRFHERTLYIKNGEGWDRKKLQP